MLLAFIMCFVLCTLFVTMLDYVNKYYSPLYPRGKYKVSRIFPWVRLLTSLPLSLSLLFHFPHRVRLSHKKSFARTERERVFPRPHGFDLHLVVQTCRRLFAIDLLLLRHGKGLIKFALSIWNRKNKGVRKHQAQGIADVKTLQIVSCCYFPQV